jgi:hypothetical protein
MQPQRLKCVAPAPDTQLHVQAQAVSIQSRLKEVGFRAGTMISQALQINDLVQAPLPGLNPSLAASAATHQTAAPTLRG